MIRQVRGDGGGEVRHHPFNGKFVLIQVIQYSESGSHIEGVPSPEVKILGGPTAKWEVNHADQPIHSQLFRLGLQPIIQRFSHHKRLVFIPFASPGTDGSGKRDSVERVGLLHPRESIADFR